MEERVKDEPAPRVGFWGTRADAIRTVGPWTYCYAVLAPGRHHT